MPRILVIDDDPTILDLIAETLSTNGYEVATAPSGESGIRELERNSYDLVLSDLVMPDVDGMEVLNHAANSSPKTVCIIITGYGTIKSSVEAIKGGAFDYISKPITSGELLVVIEKALKFKNLEEENIRLKKELRHRYRYTNLIGITLDEAVKDYEKRLILGALEKSDWVKTKAAKLLNINRTTLVEKIKERRLIETAST